MIKIKPKRNPYYMGLVIGIYAILVVAVMVLAGISQNTGFWVAAIILDLVIIGIGIFTFIKMFKPKYMSSPIGDSLQYEEEREEIK